MIRAWMVKAMVFPAVMYGCELSSVQLLSHVWLFVTLGLQHTGSMAIANSQSLLKLMTIKLVIPSSLLILCCLLLLLPSIFPSITVFLISQFLASGGQKTGASALAPVLLMNIQDWFPLGLTGLMSL